MYCFVCSRGVFVFAESPSIQVTRDACASLQGTVLEVVPSKERDEEQRSYGKWDALIRNPFNPFNNL